MYPAGRIIENTKLDEYFGCRVRRGILGGTTWRICDCLYPAGRMIEDTQLDEYFGCGVGNGHSGRYTMAHEFVCILPGG